MRRIGTSRVINRFDRETDDHRGVVPSAPVASASVAAADSAVLDASVDEYFACRSWVSPSVRSVNRNGSLGAS